MLERKGISHMRTIWLFVIVSLLFFDVLPAFSQDAFPQTFFQLTPEQKRLLKKRLGEEKFQELLKEGEKGPVLKNQTSGKIIGSKPLQIRSKPLQKGKESLPKESEEFLFNRYLKNQGPQSIFEISANLRPFGYEIFKRASPSPPSLPVPSDYIIGPGDEIQILLWGRINEQYSLKVSRDGTILVPQIGELVVAGMHYDEMKKFLLKQLKRITGTNAAITLGKLHSIQVFVLGEVEKPGVYNLSPVSTILDALLTAGGPTGIGSLRNITLKRKGHIVSVLDVYDLLLKGDKSGNKRLRHEDVIFVPPVGPLVGVAGEVKRPAVYELKGKLDLAALLDLAGGVLPSASLQHIQVERLQDNEKQIVLEVDARDKKALKKFFLQDGDLVKVFSIVKEKENVVYLRGNVRHPGQYVYRPGMRIGDIIKSCQDLLPDTLLDFAIIKRLITPDYHWEYRIFSLKGLLLDHTKKDNIELRPNDIIIVYNKWEVMPKKIVIIKGAVNKPGSYEYLPKMRISDLISLAGGLTRYAYLKKAEVIRRIPSPKGLNTKILYINLKKALARDPKHDLILQEDDVVLVRNVPEWGKTAVVEISGEVRFPGKYIIRRGERLSSVLERAGGFTKNAYLRGAIFTRESLKKLQQKRLNEMIERLEEELLSSLTIKTGVSLTPQEAEIKKKELGVKREFLARLKQIKPIGRLVIHLKPIKELKGTPDDIRLEDGDKLFIPRNPHTIQVIGAVYNQSAFLYKPDRDVSYYVSLAGGYTKNADKKEIYILKVDGSAVKSREQISFWWNSKKRCWEIGSSVKLEPGDTIVVPQRMERIAWLRNMKDITQILYQIAVTAGVIIAAY